MILGTPVEGCNPETGEIDGNGVDSLQENKDSGNLR